MTTQHETHWVIPVTGLTCASCVTRLEKSLKRRPSVERANVNLALETLDIVLASESDALQLPQWVEASGFGLEHQQVTFNIQNITCASCISRIEKSLLKMPGVVSASGNLATTQVQVTWVPGLTSLNAIKSRLAQINYPVIEETETEDSNPKTAHPLTHVLFGAALSLPMVITMIADLLGQSWMLPTAIQWVLATPIQFWLGARFYHGAFHALKNGSANMDVLVSMGTTAAYFYSLYLWLAVGSSHVYFEASAVVITLVLLGQWLEGRAKNTAGNAIRKLMNLQPPNAQKWVDDQLVTTAVTDLVIGDEIQIQPGDTLPADGVIVDGTSTIDESMLTGESLPIEKTIHDGVFAGTLNANGSIRLRVHSSPDQFRLKQIVQSVNDAQMNKPDIQKMVDKIAAVFVPVVILIALITFVLQWWLVSFDQAMMAAVSVLVIACPCALGLATPTAIMAASGVGARRGILIRDINQLEVLAQTDSLVFDKTGTLTEGAPSVVHVEVWHADASFQAHIKAIQQKSQHPLAAAMVQYLADVPATTERFKFTNHSGQGVEAKSDHDRYLIGNERLLNNHHIQIDSEHLTQSKSHYSRVWVAKNDEICARFDITDPVRHDSLATIRALKSLNMNIWMLSGDHQEAAESIAHSLGIDNVMANLLPEHKAQAIEQLKKKHRSVVMVGDGINDAPALTAATASIAIGSGTDIAMDAAGITLMRPEIQLILEAIQLAKKTRRKIQQNLFWAFIYNCIGLPLAALGLLSPIIAGAAMAFSSVSVVTSSILLLRWNPKPLRSTEDASL